MTQPGTGFAALGVSKPLCEALESRGLTSPFPIQRATLPDTLAGRRVLARGRTGSGKTVAFAIPVVCGLTGRASRPGSPRALVLVATRELAAQVHGVMAPLAPCVGLRCSTIHGGVGQGPQVADLRRGVDIIVATPGRLEDLIAQGHITLATIASRCSTRPTTWPIWASCPPCVAFSTARPQGLSGCCSPPHSTTPSRFLSDGIWWTRSITASTRPRPRYQRCATTSSTSRPGTRQRSSANWPPAAAASWPSHAPSMRRANSPAR